MIEIIDSWIEGAFRTHPKEPFFQVCYITIKILSAQEISKYIYLTTH